MVNDWRESSKCYSVVIVMDIFFLCCFSILSWICSFVGDFLRFFRLTMIVCFLEFVFIFSSMVCNLNFYISENLFHFLLIFVKYNSIKI